jgi:hypothetical protein
MTWLTLRQLRTQAAAVYAMVAAVVVVLAITGPRLVDKAKLDGNIFDHLNRVERDLYYSGIIVLAVAPAVIAVFWGAPMVAREVEAGTHRLVWNQSVTRNRWLLTKLGLTAAAAAAAVGALTWAITWWSGPVDGALSSTHGSLPSRLTPVGFAMRGLVPVGYAVFALTLGVALGTVLKRSLPAMALTLAIFTAVQIVTPLWVRPHLVPATTQIAAFSEARLDGIEGSPSGPSHLTLNTGGSGDWILSNQTINAKGKVVALPSFVNDCLGPPPPEPGGETKVTSAPGTDSPLAACFARLNAEGYHQRIAYQPASHFWPLQFAETGLFLVISGLLGWLALWRLRRIS